MREFVTAANTIAEEVHRTGRAVYDVAANLNITNPGAQRLAVAIVAGEIGNDDDALVYLQRVLAETADESALSHAREVQRRDLERMKAAGEPCVECRLLQLSARFLRRRHP